MPNRHHIHKAVKDSEGATLIYVSAARRSPLLCLCSSTYKYKQDYVIWSIDTALAVRESYDPINRNGYATVSCLAHLRVTKQGSHLKQHRPSNT
jgi:hypothetical protein